LPSEEIHRVALEKNGGICSSRYLTSPALRKKKRCLEEDSSREEKPDAKKVRSITTANPNPGVMMTV